MTYPIRFSPAYKDYLWGGRNLEKIVKVLPEGIVAEIWSISGHPDGVSVVSNGEFSSTPLPQLVEKLGEQLIGSSLYTRNFTRFPLLIKLLDANDKLSIQVHSSDAYADVYENGELGKNEMWYILSAKPGAKIIYDVKPGVDKKMFLRAVEGNKAEDCLKSIAVFLVM